MKEMELFFDALAADWDENQINSNEKIAAIVTIGNIKTGTKVVDIACGTGVMIPNLISCNPAKILGIDISKKMIEIARTKFDDPRIELVVSDLFDIAQRGFDTAIIYNAYPHFPDKQRLCNQIFDMLNDGGRLIIAHSEGKEKINNRHMKSTVSSLSNSLRPVEIESRAFSEFFDIDVMVDTSDMFMLSGIKKRTV